MLLHGIIGPMGTLAGVVGARKGIGIGAIVGGPPLDELGPTRQN